MGLDLGLKNDATSISVVSINNEGRCRLIAHEMYRTGLGIYEGHDILPIQKMAERVDYLWNFWNCKGGIYDQWNCGLPSMYVITEEGFSKRLDQVQVGDRVLTHTGKIQEVREVFKGKVEKQKLYQLQVEGISQLIQYTNQHQFQVWDDKKQDWVWKLVSDINVGDYLRSNYFVEENDDPSISLDHAELLGWLLS